MSKKRILAVVISIVLYINNAMALSIIFPKNEDAIEIMKRYKIVKTDNLGNYVCPEYILLSGDTIPDKIRLWVADESALFDVLQYVAATGEGFIAVGQKESFSVISKFVYGPIVTGKNGFGVYVTRRHFKRNVTISEIQEMLGVSESSWEDSLPDGYLFNNSTGAYEIHDKSAKFLRPINNASSITIPSQIEVFGKKVKVTSIASRAFERNNLETVTIGRNVKTIGSYAFASCFKLKLVNGCAGVMDIMQGAFYKCRELLSMPNMKRLIRIEDSAFWGDRKLIEFTISKNVKHIGKSAFRNCANISLIKVNSDLLNVNNIGKNAFQGINKKAVIKCPRKLLKAYKKLFVMKGAPKTVSFK